MGQPLSAVGGAAAVMAGALASAVDVLGAEDGLSDPHAESATTAHATPAASPMVEDIREQFTVATLPPSVSESIRVTGTAAMAMRHAGPHSYRRRRAS